MIFQLEQIDEFEPTGTENDPMSRLLAVVMIGGVHHHMEAIAVEYTSDDEMQQAADPEWEGMLNEYYNAAGGDGYWQTVDIGGREYVLCITPFCQ